MDLYVEKLIVIGAQIVDKVLSRFRAQQEDREKVCSEELSVSL